VLVVVVDVVVDVDVDVDYGGASFPWLRTKRLVLATFLWLRPVVVATK
jgi:hypothetical protein